MAEAGTLFREERFALSSRQRALIRRKMPMFLLNRALGTIRYRN